MLTDSFRKFLNLQGAIAVCFFNKQIHYLKRILRILMSDESFGVTPVVAKPTYSV